MLICYHSNDLSQNYLYMRFFIKMWFLSSYYKLVQTFIHLLLELMVEASDYSPSMPVYTCLLFYAVNNKNRASPEPVMPKFSRDIFCVTAYALSSVASGFTLVEMATKIYKVWPDSIILTQNTIISTSTSSNLIQWVQLYVCTSAVLSVLQAASSALHATSCLSNQPAMVNNTLVRFRCNIFEILS